MNNIITIIKKELRRFFFDKRMLISLILPGLLIFIIYSLMGNFISTSILVDEDYQYNVYVENLPEEYNYIIENEEFDILLNEKVKTVDEIKEDIKEKQLDLYIGFESDFTNKLNNGQKPNVTIYYNSSSNESLQIYSYISSTLLASATIVDYKFLVNFDENIKYDLASNEDLSIQMITMILPYLLIILLFSGCLPLASESIAGEKERGTIYTLLITPTKRSYIAIGKIISLSITSLVSASTTFLAVIFSLPNLLKSSGQELTLSMYKFDTFIAIFLIILLTVIFFTTILSIVSTLAKNVKEASQWSGFLMIVVMIVAISSLMGMGKIPTNTLLYLIPVYNCVNSLSSILSFSINPINIIVTFAANIVYITAGIIILAKMFNSEKIMSK